MTISGDADALEDYIEAIGRLSRARLCANHPIQWAVRPALEGPQEHFAEVVEKLRGKPGAGASIFSFVQLWERSLILAPHLGVMQRLLDQCLAFSRERKRAGIPVGKHQAVSHRIADMKLRLETARLRLLTIARQAA